jgi:hypothetical protein
MSNRSMRWFIIVDGAKKRKDLARPGTQSATGTDTKFLGEDGDAAQGIMELAPRKGLQAHMKDRVRIAEEVHYATLSLRL